MTSFAGLRGTGSFGADERPKNFREMILFRNPNGTAPIFALTSKMSKKTVDDPEFSWWDEPNDVVRLRVDGAVAQAGTTVVVDGVDPSAASPGNSWGHGNNVVPGDLLLVEPSSDAAAWNPEIILVTANAAGADAAHRSLTVARGQLGTAAPSGNQSIPNNATLLKIGNVNAEGTRAPMAATRNPIKYSNLCQIFKNTYKVTGTAAKTRFRTGDPVKNDKRRKSFDHARDIELSILYGRRSEGTGSTLAEGRETAVTGLPQRTMGGLRQYIPSTILSSSASMNTLLDAVSTVFDWESPAGDERLVFCGNGALNAFNKAITQRGATASSAFDRVQYKSDEMTYGTRFMRYRVPQGNLFLKVHPLMNRVPILNNAMFIIDPSCLKYVCVRGRDTRMMDNIQENDEDAIRGQWMTECSIMVDKGGLTMKYIGAMNNLDA
ncbi:MAG: DUF5309 family protein [Nitrospinae bacterium]|nr:DUF5309 family protein [Nitrospinota bacterium]